MPDSWTAEERRNDYGIDFDVEIFREDVTTGLLFSVQLKSTERVGRKASVRLKRSSANYWTSLNRPVLIVLYEAAQGRLWWQWWHRYDPIDTDESAAKFTLTFPERQLWDSSITPSELEREVEAYLAWANAETHLPLSVIIRGQDKVAGLRVGLIIAAVRRRLREFDRLLVMRASASGPLALTIDISPDESVIWLSGGGSATLHHQGVDASAVAGSDVAGRLSADLVLLLANRVALLGLKSEAARLAASAMRESSVINDPKIAQGTLFLLLEGGLVSDAVDLFGFLVHRGTEEVAALATLTTLSWARSADSGARRQVVDALAGWRNEPDDVQAAQFTYNAAQLARVDDLDHALDLLRRAGDLDANYKDRGYWWREQGGLLFQLGRHETAAEAYQEAVARGENTARPLLADALLWSGRLPEAIELFKQVADDASLSTSEWRLKARVFPRVHEHSAQSGEPTLSDIPDAHALYELAIESTLSPLARMELMIAAALAAEASPELWLRAIALSLDDGDLFLDVALTARRFCGDDVVDFMLEQGQDPDAAHALLEMFEQLPPEQSAPNVLRFITPGTNAIEVIDLNEPPP